MNLLKGNGQKREHPVLFWPKTDVPENDSDRECLKKNQNAPRPSEHCWPYLIHQHPLSPVFGQKRPGTPGNGYFAQLPPVFGHFMFRFWPFYVHFRWTILDCSNRSTWATRTIFLETIINSTAKFRPGDDVEIDDIFSLFFCNNFGTNPPVCLGDNSEALLHQLEPQPTSKMSTERCVDCRQSRQLMAEHTNVLIFSPITGGCSEGLGAF